MAGTPLCFLVTQFKIAVLVCVLLLVPSVSHGAVVISEIAWMGSIDSPNDEWIELHNTASTPVSLEGWFVRDEVSLEIPLSGTLDASQYAVLERTDDSSAQGAAWLVYAGALANTGGVLSVYREDGSLEDRVAGGENWENVGGDNETKQTAQSTSTGWKTADATPGQGPGEIAPVDEQHADSQVNEDKDGDTDSDGEKTVELKLPDSSLSLELIAPDIVYVNQNVAFAVEPGGLGKTFLNSLNFTWNFGDLSTASGKKVDHTFAHAGEYVVTVQGVFSHYEQVARKTIKVLPVAFMLSRNGQGDTLIHNNAKYEVNISRYTLRSGSEMTFPPRSIILPNATITIAKEKIAGGFFTHSNLYDQKGVLVASTAQTKTASAVPVTVSAPIIAAQETVLEPEQETALLPASNFLFKDEVTEGREAVAEAALPQDEQSQLALAHAASDDTDFPLNIPKNALPLLGLAGIVTVGILGVLVAKKR